MNEPRFYELDLRSEQGQQLLEATAALHGQALRDAARLARRLFLLSSPWAPGLRFVGGEADARCLPNALALGSSFSLAGSGVSLEDGLASCIGEGVERLSQVETASDVTRVCPNAKGSLQVMPAANTLIAHLLDESTQMRDVDVAWVRAHLLSTMTQVLVPADWCLRRREQGALAIPGAALSTGCAAGPTFSAAAARALLELIERDAVALWWMGGHRARPLAIDGEAMAAAVPLLGILRQDSRERTTWLIDITTDIGVPCLAAVSCDGGGRGLACGFAARLSPAAAARGAILEMCQMELALPIVAAKQRERGDLGLNDIDRRHLARALAIDAARCELLHPVGMPRCDSGHAPADADAELDALRAAFARLGIEAALIDLTRPEFAVPVVRAVAPQLQLMPCGMQVERLRHAISTAGGGEHWTLGIPLH